MKPLIKESKVKINDIKIDVASLIPPKAILREVRVSYPTDENGKRTSEVPESVKYDLVNPTTYDTFTVKVDGGTPVITQDTLESKETPVFVELPLDAVCVKPYKVEFGTAYLSITSPAVRLTK